MKLDISYTNDKAIFHLSRKKEHEKKAMLFQIPLFNSYMPDIFSKETDIILIQVNIKN